MTERVSAPRDSHDDEDRRDRDDRPPTPTLPPKGGGRRRGARFGEGESAREPPCRILLERAPHDLSGLAGRRLDRTLLDRREELEQVGPRERRATRHELVEEDTERPHVGPRVELRLAAHLLGREIDRGPEDRARLRELERVASVAGE